MLQNMPSNITKMWKWPNPKELILALIYFTHLQILFYYFHIYNALGTIDISEPFIQWTDGKPLQN